MIFNNVAIHHHVQVLQTMDVVLWRFLIDASDFATELADKIESIRQLKVRPKQRTQALLNYLRQKVNPLRTHAPSEEAQKEAQR